MGSGFKLGFALVSVMFCGTALASEITAARTLRVGIVVEQKDLIVPDTVHREDVEEIIGKEVKRSIYVGRKVSEDDVGPITVVDRNDIVRLSYRINGLWIRTEARALEPGSIDELISVMNLDTRVTVRAQVTGVKRARVVR